MVEEINMGMDEYVTGFFDDTYNLLTSVLPDSPFATVSDNASILETAAGWANWFFPVNAAAMAMEGWIAAIVAAIAGKTIIDIVGQGFEIIAAKELLP